MFSWRIIIEAAKFILGLRWLAIWWLGFLAARRLWNHLSLLTYFRAASMVGRALSILEPAVAVPIEIASRSAAALVALTFLLVTIYEVAEKIGVLPNLEHWKWVVWCFTVMAPIVGLHHIHESAHETISAFSRLICRKCKCKTDRKTRKPPEKPTDEIDDWKD